MFEVLVYMFQNYFETDHHPDEMTLERELSAAGFADEDISEAFDWYKQLSEMLKNKDTPASQFGSGMRIYAPQEVKKITNDGLSFIIFLEQAGIITAKHREMIIDRAMALPQAEVKMEEVRWIVLMALWDHNKAREYLFVEDAVFRNQQPTLH